MEAQQPPVQELPLTTLVLAARREAASGACGLELLRRAVDRRDEAAWPAVVDLYRDQVLAWVRRHPGWTPAIDAGDDAWVADVFARFASVACPGQFAAAAGLAPPLCYLKACAHAAVMDARRAARLAALRGRPLEGAERGVTPGAKPAAGGLDRIAATELWRVVTEETGDEAARAFADLAFRRGLPPREVQRARPDLFPAVADAYRVGRPLLDRLRRRPELRRFLDGLAPADADATGRPGQP